MIATGREIGLRWTIGDVSEAGFEALRLSLWGAWNIFGPDAAYAVCVNSIPLLRACAQTGDVPEKVIWHDATSEVPWFIKTHLDDGMAQGVGWKFAPLQLFPDRYELALDNDCILWEMPPAIHSWLEFRNRRTCLFAEDVRPCFGQFSHLCGTRPGNSGIRGLPPHFDYERALRQILYAYPVQLRSELDEQGLQMAAVSRASPPLMVAVEDVSICSPFPPHVPDLGQCGAHFMGLNARQLPWSYEGSPATDHIQKNWLRHREEIYCKVGVAPPVCFD